MGIAKWASDEDERLIGVIRREMLGKRPVCRHKNSHGPKLGRVNRFSFVGGKIKD